MESLKSVVVIFCITFSSFFAFTQDYKLEVVSFSLEENALTAKNEPVRDNNNQKCALVIVSGFGDENLRFDVGNTFSKVESKRDDRGERVYLLWIPEGTVKVSISSDSKNFLPLEYHFNPKVKRAETYLLTLKLDQLRTAASKQYLEFSLSPASAYLEVNNQPWPVKDGVAYSLVPKGVYSYNASAPNYYPESGTFNFTDLSTKKTLTLSLKPKFGWITVQAPAELGSLTIYIDDVPQTGSLNRIQLPSGSHQIRVVKDMYLPYNQNVDISDEKELKVSPQLLPNFSEVNIVVDEGASIYIDDEYKGLSTWSGKLQPGSYKLEVKKASHKSSSETFTVSETGKRISLTPNKLIPIYGQLIIETEPSSANIKIDNRDYGKSPLAVNNLLIGNHTVEISKECFNTINRTVNIKEDEECEIKIRLEKTPIKTITPEKSSVVRDNSSSLYANVSPNEVLGTIFVGADDKAYIKSPNCTIFVDGCHRAWEQGVFKIKLGYSFMVRLEREGNSNFCITKTIIPGKNTSYSIYKNKVVENPYFGDIESDISKSQYNSEYNEYKRNNDNYRFTYRTKGSVKHYKNPLIFPDKSWFIDLGCAFYMAPEIFSIGASSNLLLGFNNNIWHFQGNFGIGKDKKNEPWQKDTKAYNFSILFGLNMAQKRRWKLTWLMGLSKMSSEFEEEDDIRTGYKLNVFGFLIGLRYDVIICKHLAFYTQALMGGGKDIKKSEAAETDISGSSFIINTGLSLYF